MAYTTEAKVEALMSETFDTTTRPSSAEIITIISWSDSFVDAEDTSPNATQKELMSTLMAAHLIETDAYVDIAIGDLRIKPVTGKSRYLSMYEKLVGKKSNALFKKVND